MLHITNDDTCDCGVDGYKLTRTIGALRIWSRGNSAERPGSRKDRRIDFGDMAVIISYKLPKGHDYNVVNGLYVRVVPPEKVQGRPIIRREWKGTGIGPKTIENLQSLGVWTVEELRDRELKEPGYINALYGISDKEDCEIKKRIEELL